MEKGKSLREGSTREALDQPGSRRDGRTGSLFLIREGSFLSGRSWSGKFKDGKSR
jgi:hypothetical protein